MRTILKLALTALFLFSGGAKLAGAAMPVDIFEKIGIGQWFRIFTGLLEVGCALAWWSPRYTIPAAALLSATMIGAALTHVFILHTSPLVPLLTLAGCLALLLTARQQQTPAHLSPTA